MEIAADWIAAITPLYADAGVDVTASGIGLVFTYAGALGVVLQMPITQASERMGGFSIVLCSGAVQAMASACLLVSAGLLWLVPRCDYGAGANAGPYLVSALEPVAPGRRPVRRPLAWWTV